MFFTSKEAAEITGCTLRQLQYWREKEVVIPTVDATGKGRSVFYTEDDLVSLAVMEYLLSAGLEFQEAVAGLEALKTEEPEFFKPTQTRKFAIPSPSQLWQRLTGEADGQIQLEVAEKLLTSMFPTPDKPPRYYQRNAIYAAIAAIIKGQKRLLLTMATGTGKTSVAFQICWLLTSMKWNTAFKPCPPRILFLADRITFLILLR